jgi:hypothetical protein
VPCYYIHLHPSLIFADTIRHLPLEWSLVRGYTRVGSGLPANIRLGKPVASSLVYYDAATITTMKSFIV